MRWRTSSRSSVELTADVVSVSRRRCRSVASTRAIVRCSYGVPSGRGSAQMRDRRLQGDVERLGAQQDEGVDGRAPEAVPSGLAAACAEADDALPARVLEPVSPVLAAAGSRGAAPNLACVAHPASAALTNPLPRACKKPCRTGIASLT